MEEPKTISKQEKKKIVVTVGTGGGGIGGLLVLGGALAAAALIAAFTNKINKRRPRTRKSIKRDNNCSCKEEEGSEGLRSLLLIQSPSAQHECDERSSNISTTQIDYSELITIQSLILEEKPELRVNGGNETPTSGDQHKIVSEYTKMGRCPEFDDYNISKDSVPVDNFEGLSDIDVGLLEQENISKDDSMEDSLSVETTGVVGEGVDSETVQEEEMAAEENPLMQIEEEEDDDDVGENDGEYIEERGEEDSEGTGDSSVESNAEAIWPAELIEEVSLELDETKFQFQNPGEKIDEEAREALKEEEIVSDDKDNEDSSDDETKGETMAILNKEKELEFMMVDHPTLSSSSWRIWILSMLMIALLLLLLLLAHYIALSNHLLIHDSRLLSPAI